jgi:phosphatidylglycerophosphate synthase
MQTKEPEIYEPTDRRPIAARGWSIWQPIVRRMVRAGFTANAISMAGMIAGILAGVAFVLTSYQPEFARWGWLAAAIFMQLRLLANLLDGMVAIESGKASVVGELFNEVPDRVSDSAILIGAGYAMGSSPVLGCVAALSAMFTAYVRAVGKSVGAGQQFCGPMAKQQRMAMMTAAAIYLGLAPQSWYAQLSWLRPWPLVSIVLLIIIAGSLVTAFRRLMRVADHCRTSQNRIHQLRVDQARND